MKKLLTLTATLALISLLASAQVNDGASARKILAYGGQIQKAFIRQVIALTGKSKPKICFLPTATADNPNYQLLWYDLCRDLPVEAYTLNVWVNSSPEQKTFEERLMGMDAIVVGGGNTLNMIAIWKAQGIDTVLRNAYNKGIVMAGGSAGSLCWFTAGYSDSRPKALSIVNGLNFLPFSHCPHYHSELSRKPLYTVAMLADRLPPGYACDDKAGIVFLNEKYNKSITLDPNNHCYFLSVKDGKIDEQVLSSEVVE
jgi:dipeptidase E